MTFENISKIIEIIVQLLMLLVAWQALSTWKAEILGRDDYQKTKELLDYIKRLRFIIHAPSSVHQVFLNDIFDQRENFYNEQILLIAKSKVYFDKNYLSLFLRFDVRGDLFLKKKIKTLLEDLYSGGLVVTDVNKNQCTYVQLTSPDSEKLNDMVENEEDNRIYELGAKHNYTVEEYFQKWEKLITELQKDLYA